MIHKKRRPSEKVLAEGKFLRFIIKNSWEFIERHTCSGVIIILAVTDDGKIVLTEQKRVPVGKKVIEFPAGLANDHKVKRKESLYAAANRELWEETGYRARRFCTVAAGPTSGGLTSEIVTIVLAEDITKTGPGGGDESEAITVHEVKGRDIDRWLRRKQRQGCLVDPKIYAGLYFLRKYNKVN